MELIVYSNKCLSCSKKQLWQEIKHFAKKNNLTIRQKNVLLRPEWREAAQQYEIDLPFVVLNGNAIRLTEPLERLL
jgi:hypothetical protein